MRNRRFSTCLWIVIIVLLILIGFVGYTIHDNQRVILVQQDVCIPDLPEGLDGFNLLQLSDLHGSQFGKLQQKIGDLINSTDYDILVITGDMQYKFTKDTLPLFDLLKAVEHKTPILYISGNSGPYDLDMLTGKPISAGLQLQAAGVTLLDHPYLYEVDGAKIWFTSFYDQTWAEIALDTAKEFSKKSITEDSKDYLNQIINYQLELKSELAKIPTKDVLIGVIHIPFSTQTLQEPDIFPAYDLVVAGHNHGGQIRFPLIGALFINDLNGYGGGFFPAQDNVSGLHQGNGIQQYTSRGLGSSGP